MKRLHILFIAAILILLAACTSERTAITRGIGIYPGNPDESAAPYLVKGDETYRNIALGRVTGQSSSYDYNLTSQLITDGIISNSPAAFVDLTDGSKLVDKPNHEKLFDGKPDSRIAFDVTNPTVRVDFHGMSVEADRIEILGSASFPEGKDGGSSLKLMASTDGSTWTELGKVSASELFMPTAARPGRFNMGFAPVQEGPSPVVFLYDYREPETKAQTSITYPSSNAGQRTVNRTISCVFDIKEPVDFESFCFAFDLPGGLGLSLHTVNFYKDGKLLDVLPSTKFVSAWRSAGTVNEWVSVDFGFKSNFDKLVFHWLNPAASGEVFVSDDAEDWISVARIAEGADFNEVKLAKAAEGRYVKVSFDNSVNGQPFELAELEVFGKGGTSVVPKPAAVREGARQDLSGGAWKLQRASLVESDGKSLSCASFNDDDWLVATVPGTVLASYVNAGAVPDPNYADNQFVASDSYFRSPFWYRDTFDAHLDSERQYLHFDGINWKADVFLNGASIGRIEGAFREAEFDVTGILKEGRNDLAVLIHENEHYGAVKEQTAYSTDQNGGYVGADNPTMHATIGWDWIPTVRGRDIGIWDDVYLCYKGTVSIADPFVRTVLPLPDTTSADVLAEVTLFNHSDKPVSGLLKGSFGDVEFDLPQLLAPGERKLVKVSPSEVPALHLSNPKLWWPAGYGEQNLYDVMFSFVADGKISDEVSFKTGIRQMDFSVEEYLPHGGQNRGYTGNRLSLYVNGRRFIGFGGNWGFPEQLLNYRGREYDIAVGYHADMHFTMIRNWVGMTGDKEFYEACDRHGVMVWQDFWLANPVDGPNPYHPDLFNEIATEYVHRVRNHPSIAIYVGRNEGNPPAEINDYLAEMIPREHPGLYYIPHSAAGLVSGGGPYRALPVKDYFNLHGHDKMHSERGMPNVMNYENLLRAFGEDHIEPVNTLAHPNAMYGLHDYTLGGVPNASSAQAAESFNQIIAKAFGEPVNAKEFSELAQWVNYDGYRAIFEGRSEHRRGMILWMSHPAWPSMVWQTYDYYFEPTGAYFGSKKACEPIHIQWNPIREDIEVVNYHAFDRKGVKASAQLVNLDGSVVWNRDVTFDILEDQTVACFPLEFPDNLSDAYFIKLCLTGVDGEVLSENIYWRGREEGNLKALRSVAETTPKTKVSRKSSSDGYEFTVSLSNKDKVPAMMLRLKAVDSETGDLVLPVMYSDNYFFLMPGESKTVTVKVRKEDCAGKPYITLQGFNVPEIALGGHPRKVAVWNDPYATAMVEHDWILGEDKPLRFEVNDIGGKSLELCVKLATDKGEPVGEWKKTVSHAGIVPFTFDLPDGFYHVDATLGKNPLKHFVIGIGDPEKVLSAPDKAEDFDKFWERSLQELAAVDPQYKLTELPEHSNDIRKAYRVDMMSWGGEPISALLLEPVKEGKYPVYVNYLGYNCDPWYENPSDNPETIKLWLCTRRQGFNRNLSEPANFTTRGLESPETYYYHGAFLDVVRGIDLACSLPKADLSRIFAEGGSQGGAFTMIAAALDKRVRAIATFVPFLSDYPDYFQVAEWPGNEILRSAKRLGIPDEELYRTLSYFDVKNFTDRIHCPVLMGFGLQDETCPPHTNFAAYNNIPADTEKSWICFPLSGHHVEREPGWSKARDAFFARYDR